VAGHIAASINWSAMSDVDIAGIIEAVALSIGTIPKRSLPMRSRLGSCTTRQAIPRSSAVSLCAPAR
jgi:hypothetical protein